MASALLASLLSLLSLATLASSNSVGEDALYAFNAYLPIGNKCSAQTLGTWNEEFDLHYACGSTTASGTSYFNPTTGIFTPPVAGYYHCCASARIRQGGYGDLTIDLNASPVAGFGTRCTGNPNNCQWIHVSNCVNLLLATSSQVRVQMQSTAGSDCVEETNYRYAQFNCNLIFSTDTCPASP